MADTLNLIRRFVDRASARIPEKPRGRGSPPFPARDVAKALLLQTYFGVSDRVAAGLVRLFKEKLGISKEFSYKTIERGYDPSPASEILREVFRLTNEHGNAKETDFWVDGTGEPTSSKVNYESDPLGAAKERREKEEERKHDPSTIIIITVEEVRLRLLPPQRRRSGMGIQLTVMSVGVHTKLYARVRDHG